MSFKWRKWNRIIHRDFGYFFFGMIIIYAFSGIAINHINDWNPNYIVITKEIQTQPVTYKPEKDEIKEILQNYNEENNYKSHYFPEDGMVKVFLKNGTAWIDLTSGNGLIEKTKRRSFFREVNYLHYNPIVYWTWFSDIFAGSLIIIAISGLFIVRGPNGITKRGLWLTLAGISVPVIFLIIYFY